MSFTFQQSSLLSPLLGDEQIMGLCSAESDISAMLLFETALAKAQAKLGFIPLGAAEKIDIDIASFQLDHDKLKAGVAQDGMVVPALVSQLKTGISPHIHFGATSQDVIDSSLMIRAKQIFSILVARLKSLISHLDDLSKSYGMNRLMARTRMQQALPFTAADRIASWRTGLVDALQTLQGCRFPVQFGGPIGVLGEFGERAMQLRSDLASLLNLDFNEANWHSTRGPILALGHAASQLTASLGKIGTDYCLMAQNEFSEVRLRCGGTSSAMHHKQNPVLAETLVTLARFNATLVSGLHHTMLHEQERSGSAWTLEWMVLPQMMVTAGSSTRLCGELFTSTVVLGQA